MEVQTIKQHQMIVIQLKGELDAHSVTLFEPHSQHVLDVAELPVAFDLSDVEFIDSSGIGMLVFMVKRIWAQQRKVCLVGMQGQPARLITMLRIPQSIPCYSSIEEFLALCQTKNTAAASERLS